MNSTRKLSTSISTNGTIVNYFLPDVLSANDYFSFGSATPGRNFNSNTYKYGFNGKEKESEINTGAYDFGARVYDARVGRWFARDPHEAKYPGISNYSFSFNNPLIFNDPDGKDGRLTVDYENYTITLETTVHLYGTGATDDLVKSLNSEAKDRIQTKQFYKDGKLWTVNIKVTYSNINKDVLEKNLEVNGARGGAQQVGDIDNDHYGKLKEFIAGDNILQVGAIQKSGLNGHTGLGASGASVGSKSSKTVFHEVFHMLGYDDSMNSMDNDYGNYTEGSNKGELPIKGFILFSFHYYDLLEYALAKYPSSTNKVYNSDYLRGDKSPVLLDIDKNKYKSYVEIAKREEEAKGAEKK